LGKNGFINPKLEALWVTEMLTDEERDVQQRLILCIDLVLPQTNSNFNHAVSDIRGILNRIEFNKLHNKPLDS